MTLIRKRTMKLVAVAMIAALVVLMLPLTAKAQSWAPEEGEFTVYIYETGIKGEPLVGAKEIARYSGTINADAIDIDATNKTVTFKNMVLTGIEEFYIGNDADGYTFIFEGTNSITILGGASDSDMKVTIGLKDDNSKLTITNAEALNPEYSQSGYQGCILTEGITVVAAEGVTATPSDFMTSRGFDTAGTVVFSKGGSSEDTPTTDYIINDGSTEPITAQTGKDLVIKCSGPVEHLSNVLMDGNEVAAENMSVESGSTILTLKAAYLATLAAGEHTVSFVYDDGTTVDATFTLTKTPQTGDPMATYVLVAAIAAGVATTVVIAKKKTVND